MQPSNLFVALFVVFFYRLPSLYPSVSECTVWLKNVYPRNNYRTVETLFEKLDCFVIRYMSWKKLFKNLAKFVFKWRCIQVQTFKVRNQQSGNGNMSQYWWLFPQFLCSNLYSSTTLMLTASLHQPLDLLEGLAFRCFIQYKLFLIHSKTTIEIKLGAVLESRNQRHDRWQQAMWLWDQTLCLRVIQTDTKESNVWLARAFGTSLLCTTFVWFQQCKIWSQLDQILFCDHFLLVNKNLNQLI